jgi:hypothetical protein
VDGGGVAAAVRQWARRGTRPRQTADQRYESAYLFGAICPARGIGAALALPFADTEASCGVRRKEKKGDNTQLDPSMNRKPYAEVGHFSMENPGQSCVEINRQKPQRVGANDRLYMGYTRMAR